MSFSFIRRGLVVTALALSCLAAAAPAAVEQVALPSFACYEARFTSLRSPTLRIVDQFSKRTTTLSSAVSFCTPARAKGAPAGAPVHLACHSVQEQPLAVGAVAVSSLSARVEVTPVAAQTLCTPAAVTTGGALTDPPSGLDDFTCYRVRAQTASAGPLVVADRFGASDDVLGRIVSICAPASVNGSRPHQRAMLVCHELTSKARASQAIVRSRYGLLKASPGLRRQFCVPSY